MNAKPPEPCYFGEPERQLFGWLYLPQHIAPGTAGLVLCNPLGYDAVSAHRSYRCLASLAAQQGIPTLRFDYYATGDSAGQDTDAEQLQSWIWSIGQAVQQLRQHGHVDEVCLFGMRLGALLALVAAQDLPGVSAFVALNPVSSGRRYVRELKALAATNAAAEVDNLVTPGLHEAAGFAMSDATHGDVQALDLASIGELSIRRALLIDRSDLPQDDSLASMLEARGIDVARKPFAGYTQMMLDAQETVLPVDMLREIAEWLARKTSFLAQYKDKLEPDLRTSIQFVHDGVTVQETASFLDPEHRIFGIVSRRASSQGISNSPQILLLPNSGSVAHTGPNRLYVKIARSLAATEAITIRFDVTGLGDSPARAGEADNVVYAKHAIADVGAALAFARQLVPAAPLHLAGICSGAYHSLKASLTGTSLQSITLINPLVFFYKEGMSLDQPDFQVISEARRYRRTSLQLSSWLKVLRGRVDLLAAARIVISRVGARWRHSLRDVARRLRLPLRDDLAAEIRTVSRRGTHMLFAFAASDPGLDLLREEGGHTVDELQRRDMLQIRIIDNADHTFTRRRSQDELIRVLSEQLARTSSD